jgi:hypothetical protein
LKFSQQTCICLSQIRGIVLWNETPTIDFENDRIFYK